MDLRWLRSGPFRNLTVGACCALAWLLLLETATRAQQPPIVGGSNVNMVSGTAFPDGDPFLQRQNEPSSAASTRNPLHLLAGANDYRTVDLPGTLEPLKGFEANADAWLGVFKSFDGGQTWRSTLLPGFPQDTSAQGLASPLKGRQAGTDPVVRAGTNGLFYYAGVAFDRGEGKPSVIFVSRFWDLNNREAGDPIAYLSTKVIAASPSSPELDKTALAVDIPRSTATCVIQEPQPDGTTLPKQIPAGNVYVAYSAFTGEGASTTSQILFSRSTNCGDTWSTPVNVAIGTRLNQNAQIAIDPVSGAIYVSWRAFKSGTQGDGVYVAKSINSGASFGKPVRIAPIYPYDQGTSLTSFRSNGFQTMTVDAAGRVYVAWSERGHATLRPDAATGDARIVVSTSTTGTTWTVPRAFQTDGLGHQLMPSLSFQAGRLRLLYYDLREDVSQVFGQYVDEKDVQSVRHTLDVYVAQAAPAAVPVFTTARLSDYASGFPADSPTLQQLQFNPPNLPLFRQGTVPFMGDYLDLAPAPAFVIGANGGWTFNSQAGGSTISHAFWTDNRDVRAPIDGNWQNYTPVTSDALQSHSVFDPSQTAPPCVAGHTGMRNQNIYTARVTEGLFVGSPGNTKPLDSIQRAFVVSVQNEGSATRSYRLSIANQPTGGAASFAQFTAGTAPQTTIDVSVPAFSTVARSVYASTSTPAAAFASIRIDVNEIAAPGATGVLPGGQTGTVILNADSLNPSIQNPSIQNPSIQNPSIQNAEVYNPNITTAFVANPSIQNPSIQNVVLNPSIQNPSIQNPSIQNPSLQNDAVANPTIINPSIQNPSIQNPSIQNPSLQNPSIQNADVVSGAIEDTTWVMTNDGNTTASYAINLVMNGQLPAGFGSQLLVHKTYSTPAAQDCTLALQPHMILLANVPNPVFTTPQNAVNPSIQNPSIQNPTISLAPGESADVTLRITDPNRFDGVTFDAAAEVTPAVVAHSVNTEDAAQGITQPRFALPLTITTAVLASASPGGPYQQTLQSFAGNGTTTWSLTGGSLPPGLQLDSAGLISGTPTTPGNYVFTVQSTDATGRSDAQTLSIQINPSVPSGFNRVWNGADTNWSDPKNWSPNGVPLATDDVYIAAGVPVMPSLTQNATVHTIAVEAGATLNTNGFTLSVTGDAFAGRTIVGTGVVALVGSDAHVSGTFPNVTVGANANVSLVGQVTVVGDLRLDASTRLTLNRLSITVTGNLITNAPAQPPLVTSTPTGALLVGGVDVNGLSIVNVTVTIGGGALVRFDNVVFDFLADSDPVDELTINHPGATATFSGVSFLRAAAGRLVVATDTQNDGVPLVIQFVNANQADGSTQTATSGGATVTWNANPGDANVAIAGTAPAAVVAGSPLTYTLAVVNGGPAAASGVVVTDTLPDGVTFVSATGPGGACPVSAGVVTCTVGAVAAGQTVVIQISVITAAAGSLVNTATVQATTPDPVASNNSTLSRTSVLSAATAADLSITMIDSADPVSPGTPFTYTMAVHNAGAAAAADVVVRDEAPPGITFTSAAASGGTCTIAGGVATCTLGTLAAGQGASVTVTAIAASPVIAVNYASVSSTTPDPSAANNIAVQATTIAQGCSAPAFSSPTSIQAFSGDVFALVTADVDGNGTRDLVASSQGGRGVSLLRNDGQGHFTASSFSGTSAVRGVVVADFNGDGHPDVAAVRSSGTAGDLLILRGDGAGSFSAANAFPLSSAGISAFALATADFNEDGHPDVVIGSLNTNGPIVMLNDGTGNFAAASVVATGTAPSTLVAADFNEDGHADIAVGHRDVAYVSILLGNGNGTFTAPTNLGTMNGPRVRAAGDLNHDGHVDLLVVDSGVVPGSPTRLTMLMGDGHGAFGGQVAIRSAATVNTAAIADVNGDGRADIVSTDLASNVFLVHFGDGTGGFGAGVGYGAPVFSNVIVDDFSGDGQLDVAIGDSAGFVRVYPNSCGQAPIDVSVAASDSPDPVNEGGAVTYTATVRNLTGAPATNLSIIATLPQNTTLIQSSSSAGGTELTTGTVVTWTISSLDAGAAASFTYEVGTATGGSATFTVGVTSDGADTDPSNNSAVETTTITASGSSIIVTNTSDSGPGSLRQAILDSNADAGDVDSVTFNIPGAGVHTIALSSPLPTITQPVVIDGSTQPGFTGTPLIEVNGNGVTGNGLQVNAGNSTIRGLAINGFAGQGIVLAGTGNTIEGNFIGSDATGTLARPNTLNGIFVTSANNRIGGTAPGAGNFIAGNTLSGILVSGTSASGNTIQGNLIGSSVAEGVLDPLEAPNTLESSDILQQQNGTATVSTAQNHTALGSHSISLTPTGAGPHNIAVGGPINDTPLFGSLSVFFYDAGPGLSVSFEMVNSVTGGIALLGTEQSDPGCYRAFVAPTPGDVHGPNAGLPGCATNVDTTNVARSVGWHKFAIRADGQKHVLSIDDRTVFELAGTDGFDALMIGLTGDGSGPAYFFDDVSITAGGGATLPNRRGVEIVDAANTIVGGTSAAARNVISGNANEGIRISGAGATGTVVQGNYIGTNTSGMDAIGNGTGVGVFTTTTIGGAATGAGNVISGNVTNGISVSGSASSNAVIQGNIIGPRADLSDAIGNLGRGVLIDTDVSGAQIGGTQPGAGNIVAGSQFADIVVAGTNTTVQGNTISTDPAGTFFWSSGAGGINLAATASSTLVGGTAPGARNLISGTGANHTGNAVSISGHDNRIEGNYIGTNASGGPGVGNGGAGIGFTASASDNIVGGTTPGAGNVIAQSYANGVAVNGTGNLVAGNRIGTNATGTQALPNGFGTFAGGVAIAGGSTGNRIGGAGGIGNQVSGNVAYGILVDGDNAVVMGNVVGLNAAGTGALPNGDGIRVGANAHNAHIGGTGSGEGNVVSGNSGFGISLFGTIGGHLIQGNDVGTNVAVTGVVGNANTGIWVPSPNNTIGGSVPGAGNVVAGNLVNGIQLSGAAAVGNVVQGNWIGTERTNTLSLGNTQIGIDIINGATNAVIGGPGTARNTITHNQTGVQIRTGSAGNVLRNNAIVANSFLGVNINDAAVNNTIGGTGAGDGNVIQGNGKNLVVVNATSVGNAILGNSISGNLIGIDLGNDGVTANDANDVDSGPNNLQNFPVLTSAVLAGSTLTVAGTLNSAASTLFRLEFFSNAACDPTGNGDGDTFLGSLSVTTDGTGNAGFTATLPPIPGGQSITATATDPNNNTSEFSACRVAAGAPAGVSRVYVVHSGSSNAPGTLSVIDPATNLVTNVISVGPNSQDAALAPDGSRLYVTDFTTNSVSIVDPATNAVVGTIPNIASPIEIVVNPAGTRAYVVGNTGFVFVIGLASNTIVATIPVGSSPNGIALKPDGSRAYVANQFSDSVSVIDTAANAVIATIPVGTLPRKIAVTPDGTRAYVSNVNSNNVSVIDLTTNAVTATVSVGSTPQGIGVTADGSQVYVSNFLGDTISRISTATNAVVGTIAFSGRPYTVEMMANNRAYVVANNASQVRLIDTVTNTITAAIPTNSFPLGITSGLVPASASMADLSIALSDDPDPAPAGATVSFTIGATNNGPNPATSVVVTTAFAPGTVLQSFSGAQTCGMSGTFVTCVLGTVAGGSTTSVTLHVLLPAGTSTTTARVNAAEGDPQIANNAVSITTTVNSAPTIFTVTTTNDSGAGSLRQAIVDANARVGALDTIAFNIPGTGVHTIAPLSALPAITDPVIIDGTTQAGYAGAPLVELNGTGAGNTTGLTITAGGSTVRALAINRYSANGITISGGNANIIEGNYIGTDATGSVARGNLNGIVVQSANNRIGGTSAPSRNVISGNSGAAVYIQNAAATGNVVAGNYIGTNASGSAALPNTGLQSGVFIQFAANNTIGGTGSGTGNVVSGNAQHAITICCDSTANGNVVQGNLVGTAADGTTALGNGGIGVDIVGAANSTVGGGAVARNVIANNGTGVQIRTGAAGNVVHNNEIKANTGQAVRIQDASGNSIGGANPGDGNVIVNNGTGIAVVGASSGNSLLRNSISGNTFLGIDLNGDGVTADDDNDADDGPNALQNYPVLVPDAGGVRGQINTTPNTSVRIDYYSSPTCDASGHGEGQTFLDAVSNATDGAGNASLAFVAAAPGLFITATATDPNGNTSEFSACAQVLQAIGLSMANNLPIGVGRSVPVTITLPRPAPAGGALVTVTSDSTGVAAISSPRTALVSEGATTGQVAVNGVGVGTTTLRANATGYFEGTLGVTVTQNLISTPATLNVALGQTTALPISIGPSPAPAGGLTLDVVSSDPSTIAVTTAQVTVPPGALSVNATVRGAGVGSAKVTVSNPSYSPSDTSVASTAALDIVQGSASFNNGLTPPTLTVQLESNGTPIAAQPAVTVTLAAANPQCVSVPTSVTIASGLVSTTFQPAYGGTATLPCTSVVTASATNLTSDTVSITVNPSPAINAPGALTVGSGLMESTSGSLGAAQHGGVDVTVSSNDSHVLVSPNAATAGTPSFTTHLNNGFTSIPYYVHALENTTSATGTVTISAPGFTSASHTITVVQPGVEIPFLTSSTTTLSGESTNWYVQVGVPNPTGTNLTVVQSVRAGAAPLVVTLTNSAAAVATLRSDEPAATAQSVTKPIQPGFYYTQAIGVGTSGGVSFRPLSAGTTTVTVTGPAGVRTMTNTGVRQVQVSAPTITAPAAVTVGSGLMESTSASLGAGQHGGIDVTVSSNDSHVLVSPNATTAGTASFTVHLNNGLTSIPYYLHALENTASATATVTISAPAFTSASHTVTVVQSGVEIALLPTSMTTLSGDFTNWYVQVGLPNAAGTNLTTVQNVRAGAAPLVVTLTNSQAAVATLLSDEPAATAQTVTKPIQPGVYYTQAIVAGTSYGLTFRPLGSGTTTVTVSGPAGVRTMTNTGVRQVQVSGAGINGPGPLTVGSGLMQPTVASLGASQHGGVDVTVSSNDSHVLVSENATTAGTGSFTTHLNNGVSSIPYYVHALENTTSASGTVTISAAGFTSASQAVTVVQPGVEIASLPSSTTNLSPDFTNWYVQVGVPNPSGANLTTVQSVRAGATPLVVTLTNSASTVAQLRSDEPAATGQAVTKPIQPGFYYSQAIVPGTSYGLAFEPLSNGTTSVTATGTNLRTMTTTGVRQVDVSTPQISAPPQMTVGAGLQQPVFAALGAAQHGGVDVTITSSAPSVVLVSPDSTTAGAGSIAVPMADGGTTVPFHIQGVEGANATAIVSLSAPGFISTTMSVTVSAAGIEIVNLPFTMSATAPDAASWYVQAGVPNAARSALQAAQAVRAGSPGFVVTISSDNGAVAQLRSDEPPATGQVVSKPIQEGTYYTQAVAPGSTYGLAFDPLGAGTVHVTAAGPGGVISTDAARLTIVIDP